MARPATDPDLFAVLTDELRPYPGRLGQSLRMALAVVLVVAFAMSQNVPEAALSCYLIFFATRDNAGSGMLIAIALIVGASVGILIGLVFLQLAADEPMLRLLLMVVFTFGGMYFAQASKAGPIAATIGFVFAFVMTLYDIVPVAELLSRALSWMWVVVFVPMAVLILINATIGPNPAALLRDAVVRRLRVAADAADGIVDGAREKELAEGNAAPSTWARMARLFGYLRGPEQQALAAALAPLQRVLTLAPSGGAAHAASLRRLANRVAARGAGRPLPELTGPRDALGRAIADLALTMGGQGKAAAEPKEPALAADAFTNPAYFRFAVKALIAVLITYTFYTAWDWFEIHTAMITCFYVALGSAGETLHKSTLRILGCVIGALMGVGTIVFLMPHMTDLGHLLIVVGAGSLIAAWVSQGSSRIQYMGWQMALAFFLCVLPGFGPSFDIGVATNRVLGIIFGNLVVGFVFSTLWPVGVGEGVARALRRAGALLADSLTIRPLALAGVGPALDEARRLDGLGLFENHRVRARTPAAPPVTVIGPVLDDLAGRIAALGPVPRGTPRCVKAATLAYQAALAEFLEIASSAIVPGAGRPDATVAKAGLGPDAARRRLERIIRRQGRGAADIRPMGWKRELDRTMTLLRAIETDIATLAGAR